MSEEAVLAAPDTNGNNGRVRRIREVLEIVSTFINKVGLATVIVLVIIGLGVGIVFGGLNSPFLTSGRSEEMFVHLVNANTETAKMLREVGASLERGNQIHLQQLEVIRQLRCDMKPTTAARLGCYQEQATLPFHP